MTPLPLFEADSLTLAAGEQLLLARVTLSLAPGERVALTGPSGSGKTTLLRALCALDDPTSGIVRLEGRTPAEWGYPEFRRRVVYVAQQPALSAVATVEEALRLPFTFQSARAAGTVFAPGHAAELLERFGVGAGRLSQRARSLSVGQQQRVCLVRALLMEPAVLLLDEPTAALDPDSVASVEAYITEQSRARGLAALIVTHDRAQTERWCSRRIDLTEFTTSKGEPVA